MNLLNKLRRDESGRMVLGRGLFGLGLALGLMASAIWLSGLGDARPVYAQPVDIDVTAVTATDTDTFTASGVWSISGNQCWTPGSRFHGFIVVYEDPNGNGVVDGLNEVPDVTFTDNSPPKTGLEDSASGTGVLQTVMPAPCEGGVFDDASPPASNLTASNEPWPAAGQSPSPSEFSLGPGTHFICAAVLHVQVSGADAAAAGCLEQAIVVPPTPGSILIAKETDPDGGTGFGFSGDLGTFTLDDDEDTTFSDLKAGTYDVTESSLPAGSTLDSIVCSGDEDDGNVITLASATVSIDLDEGEGIACLFTNTLPSLTPTPTPTPPPGGPTPTPTPVVAGGQQQPAPAVAAVQQFPATGGTPPAGSPMGALVLAGAGLAVLIASVFGLSQARSDRP